MMAAGSNPNPLDPLFAPIRLGSMTAPNRFMMTTHNPKLTDARYLPYLEERVKHGVGMVGIPVLHESVSAPSFVDTGFIDPSVSAELDYAPDPATDAGADFYDKVLLPRLRSRVEICHRYGAICVGQVSDRGAVRVPETFQPRTAPSQVVDDYVRAVPHQLTIDEIASVVRTMARSAERIKRSGADGVEVHATHGYLIEQFLSPFTNRRTDDYGGTRDKRFRFLREVIEAIQRICGHDYPIGVRISGHQDVEGGLTFEDIQYNAALLGAYVAYINITAGTFGGFQGGPATAYVAPWTTREGFNVEAAAAIKAHVDVPVIVTGRLVDPHVIRRIVTEGQADMVGLTRALMADPRLVAKMAQGAPGEVRKCIGANECHFPDRAVACSVNAQVGHEKELPFTPATRSKKVLVVGGGPGGMEAARVAALRGHTVTLFERSERLGGMMASIARDARRPQIAGYIEFLERELGRHGVAVTLGRSAGAADIRAQQPDVIILATGAVQAESLAPSGGTIPVVSAQEIFDGRNDLGDRVLVIGGLEEHLPAPTTAVFLAEQGKTVTLLTECLLAGLGLESSVFHAMNTLLLTHGVDVRTQTRFVRGGPPVIVRHLVTRAESALAEIDAIVVAMPRVANDGLWEELRSLAPEVYRIGDCLAPRRMVHATLDGARIGMRL